MIVAMLPLIALILICIFLVSVISLIGIVFVVLSEKWFNKALLMLVGFASGSLLGGAFFHLIPEAIEKVGKASSITVENIFLALALGLLIFFVLEKFLWRHCHEREKCPVHPFAYLNLVGDGIHNFIDGIIIAASFMASQDPSLGFIVTLAVAAHEIPQEIGDFSILLYGGFSKTKALIYNFLTALTAMAGGIFTFYGSAFLPQTPYLLAFAAGGFIYIASTDLIPELHRERKALNSFLQFIMLSIGLFLMWMLKHA